MNNILVNNMLRINTLPSKLVKSAAAVLTLLVAFVALASPVAATAQGAQTEVTAPQTVAAPTTPDGSWLYTVTIPGYVFKGVESYHTGGTYSEADQLSFAPFGVASAGHGVWNTTSTRAFRLTYINLTFDGFSSGNPTGTLKVRQTAFLDKTGNVYTGSGDYTYYDLNGNPIPSISGTFTITAKRILASNPGQ